MQRQTDDVAGSALRAAALRYDPEQDDAPVLSAFGQGHMARRIIDRAVEAGVPVLPDPGLADMLAKLSVGDDIPPALYEAVAQVLLFVGELNSGYGSRIKTAAGTAGEAQHARTPQSALHKD